MTFGEKLNDVIKSENISVSGLYKKTGLQRSMLYAIMRGDRRLTPENAGRLINTICFPEKDVLSLFGSYIESELSAQELDAWRVFMSGLRGALSDEIKKGRAHRAPRQDIGNDRVFYGAENVIGAIGSALDRPSASLISDFRFDGEIPALVYDAYIHGKVGAVEHVIRLDDLTPAQKLRSLFCAVVFAEAGIATGIHNRGGDAYDSFILTDDHFILYMDDLSQASVFPAGTAPLGLAERMRATQKITFRFADVADSVLKNEYIVGSGAHGSWLGFATSFPLVFASKENVLESLSPDLLGNPDALTMANGLEGHFSVTTSGMIGWHSLMTDAAVEDFFKNGTVHEAPKELFPRGASIDTRIDLAKPFLHTPDYKLTILQSKYFGELKQYLTANDSSVQFFGVSGGDPDAAGAFTDIRVILNDPQISRLIKKFTVYLTNSYFCMPESVGNKYLSQRISVLEGMKTLRHESD